MNYDREHLNKLNRLRMLDTLTPEEAAFNLERLLAETNDLSQEKAYYDSCEPCDCCDGCREHS